MPNQGPDKAEAISHLMSNIPGVIEMSQDTVKKAPAIITESPAKDLNEVDVALETQVQALIDTFNWHVQSIDKIPILSIETRLQSDFVLNALIPNYQKTKEICRQLINYTRQRLTACRGQSGYQLILISLLNDSNSKLQEFASKLTLLHANLSARNLLLSPVDISNALIKKTQIELLSTLELFVLSFSVIQFKDKTNPDALFFNDQLTAFITVLHEGLSNKKNRLNKEAGEQLITELRKHLGIKSSFDRFLNGETNTKLENEQIAIILNNLLPKATSVLNEEALREQLASLNDLIARISAFPILKIKNFTTLVATEHTQHEDLLQQHQFITGVFNRLQSSLQEAMHVFSDSPAMSSPTLVSSISLLKALNKSIEKLPSLLSDYQRDSFSINQIQAPLERLDEMTILQQGSLQRIKQMQDESLQYETQVEHCIFDLTKQYKTLRNKETKELVEAIYEARCAMKEQEIVDFERLKPFELSLVNLNNPQNMPSLGEIASISGSQIRMLKRYVQEIKNELKVKWAKEVLALISVENTPLLINQDHSVEDLILLMNKYRKHFNDDRLRLDNPLQQTLKKYSEQSSLQVESLINEFSLFETLTGSQLTHWVKRISLQYRLAEDSITTRNIIASNANIIERRLHDKGYQKSLDIISTIETELVRILQGHIEMAIVYNGTNETLLTLREDPEALLTHFNLNSETTAVLNQIDLRLAKLLSIRKDYLELNAKFIHVNVALCPQSNYISRLFKITVEHLQNNSMEELSKGLGKRSNFVFWLRTHILKPLVQYQQLAREYLSAQRKETGAQALAKPRLFTPVNKTPWAGKSEETLMRTGQETLASLESEYPDTLGVSAA